MITELFMRQLEKEEDFIYKNIVSFALTFYGQGEAEMAETDQMFFYVLFNSEGLCVQRSWVDEDENQQTGEGEVTFSEYNAWLRGLGNE